MLPLRGEVLELPQPISDKKLYRSRSLGMGYDSATNTYTYKIVQVFIQEPDFQYKLGN